MLGIGSSEPWQQGNYLTASQRPSWTCKGNLPLQETEVKRRNFSQNMLIIISKDLGRVVPPTWLHGSTEDEDDIVIN